MLKLRDEVDIDDTLNDELIFPASHNSILLFMGYGNFIVSNMMPAGLAFQQ